ncbi:hypothetical protein R70723_23055 [Paenibacillus sp. FSL R7-0273]|nr:hypothetical protein R70723_23055 [Paenibacillus sp. FSL R7-0273]OMF86316.1 hypothetical protein BK144_26340 [Paenibacillus sp. FSL R7-0273]
MALKGNLRKAHLEQEYRTSLENQIVNLAKEAAALEIEAGNIQSSLQFLNAALRYHPEDE